MKRIRNKLILGISLAVFAVGFMIVQGDSRATESSKSVKIIADQVIGSRPYRAELKIGPKGIIYKNEVMKEERFIPWREIPKWKYSTKRYLGNHEIARDYSTLDIIEYTGSSHVKNRMIFKICCATTEGYDLLQLMRKYHPRGEY